MTARRATLEKAAAQERVIAALLASGDPHVADRLRRCMEAMTARRNGAGWPWACRTGAGCAWCGRTLVRRWWTGMRRWIGEGGGPVSLAVLPLHHPRDGLRAAVARLRRAVRDVRDRAARRRAKWKGVALAGMATGDGTASILVSHPGIERKEVACILQKRWPGAAVVDAGAVQPSWSVSVEDAAEVARIRRGVEPLRIVVLAQHAANRMTPDLFSTVAASTPVEPMPILF